MSVDRDTYEAVLQQLAESERKREEEQVKRVEAGQKSEEEQVKRMEAERKAEDSEQREAVLKGASRRLELSEALKLWHSLYSQPTIKHRHESDTMIKRRTTSAVNRFYPRHLRHWTDFPARQEAAFVEVLQLVAFADPDTNRNTFSSERSYRDEAARAMSPLVLRTEPDLEIYQHLAVELFVGDIWSRLPARGALDFQRRPPQALDDSTDRLSQISIDSPVDAGPSVSTYLTPSSAPTAASILARSSACQATTPPPPPHQRTLDALCSLKSAESEVEQKLFAIEYKAADILTPSLLKLGLHDLDLEAVIHRRTFSTVAERKLCEQAEKEVAEIVTQVYDYMIDKGVT